jgi:outer membrane protein assembly factor BamD
MALVAVEGKLGRPAFQGDNRAKRMNKASHKTQQPKPGPARPAGALLRMAAVGALAASASACSSPDAFNPMNLFSGEKYKTVIAPDVPADDLYNQGLARLQKKDFNGASTKFADLEKQNPYSQWQRKGLLMTTFSQYQSGSYDDAIGSAQRYIGLYPTSPDIAYVYYLQGMSYYNQIPDINRDQERSAKAAALFALLVEKFPKSEYAEDARHKLQVARDQLAGKEMLVGRYYLNQHNYSAAINRFREVLAKYQTTRHAEEALMRLTEAYLALGITNEAQTAAAVLGHNFPDSIWYKDAYARLQSGGLEPHEDKGSWISKAFLQKMGFG